MSQGNLREVQAPESGPMTGRGYELGARFEAELRASVHKLFGERVGDRCKIPDEKRQRRPDGSYGSFGGELRIADLQIVLPGGRTVYIEAKATSRPEPITTVRASQWETLELMVAYQQESWLLLHWRTVKPPFVSECLAVPAAAAVRKRGSGIGRAWARENGEPLSRMALPKPLEWGWDLRPITRRKR